MRRPATPVAKDDIEPNRRLEIFYNPTLIWFMEYAKIILQKKKLRRKVADDSVLPFFQYILLPYIDFLQVSNLRLLYVYP